MSGGIVSRQSGLSPRTQPREHTNTHPATLLEIEMDDGSLRTFPAWRRRHDFGFPQALATIHVTPDGDGDMADSRAFATAMQAGLLHLPYGGACGTIRADVRRLSRDELWRLARGFATAFPDMAFTRASQQNAGTLLSGWLSRDLRSLRFGLDRPSALPLTWEEAIGLGAFTLVDRLHPAPGRWALHGCDQTAIHLARLMSTAGWKLVAASDWMGAVENPRGLTPSELASATAGTSGLPALVGESGTRSSLDLCAVEADLVVVSSARLGLSGAARLNCRTVIELGTDSVGPAADEILSRQGIVSVPGFAATAGGTVYGHLAQLQRKHRLEWDRQETAARLLTRLQDLATLPDTGMLDEARSRAVRFIALAGWSSTVHAL
jgi:glutamate dehydrogenase (NADP+)